ncbi:MAG: hypothetical protein HPM95_15510 [Alphaproteobacteria bacterium]|nr:hypothetical protein [Alphaproteobacteria bacterium]
MRSGWRVDLPGILRDRRPRAGGHSPGAVQARRCFTWIVVFPIAGFVLLTGGNVDISAGFWTTYAALGDPARHRRGGLR